MITLLATVTADTTSTLEILAKVNEFYVDAWTMLVVLLGGLGVIIGVGVPLFITWFRKTQFRISAQVIDEKIAQSEANLVADKNAAIKEVKEAIGELKSELISEISVIETTTLSKVEQQFNDNVNELDERLKKMETYLNGSIFHVQAIATSFPFLKVRSALDAMECYIHSEETYNLSGCLNIVSHELQNVTREELLEFDPDGSRIQFILEQAMKLDNPSQFIDLIYKIRTDLKSIQQNISDTQQ